MKTASWEDLVACAKDANRRTDGSSWDRGIVAQSTVRGLVRGIQNMERDRQRAIDALSSDDISDGTKVVRALKALEIS